MTEQQKKLFNLLLWKASVAQDCRRDWFQAACYGINDATVIDAARKHFKL